MDTLYPLTFKFGEIGVQKLTENDLNYYKFITESLIEEKVQWANEVFKELPDLLTTTPLYKETIQANPSYINILFDNWCENITQISKSSKAIQEKCIILINLQGANRLKQIGHISTSIYKLLKAHNLIRVILLVNNSPIKEDIQFQQLFPCINDGNLVIIDKKGTVFAKENHQFNIEKYNELNRLRLPLSYENIRNKMIRKIGHYKIKSSDLHCNRYFYDGEYCETEVKELLLDYIFRSIKDSHKLKRIIYGSTYSPWLIKAISALDAVLKNDFKEEFTSYLGCFRIEDGEIEECSCLPDESVLLVLDFVDTGRTLTETTPKIFEKFKGLNNEDFHPISILIKSDFNLNESTELIKNGLQDKRYFTSNNTEYTLTYFMSANVAQLDASKECDYCKLGLIPVNPLNEENTAIKLNSLDFWYLADKYNYKAEDDPSPLRLPLKTVPKFEKWIEDNSTFLAYRFVNNIDNFKKENGINYVFIYPIEDHKTNAAHLFALKLNYLFNNNIIAIPKKYINAITALDEEKQIKIDELKSLNEAWRKSITKMSSKEVEVAILDEFHKGGTAFKGIKKIVNILFGEVKSYFVIADFNPKLSISYSEASDKFKVYSLYDFDIYN